MLGDAWSRPGVSGLRRLELYLDGTMVTEVIWDLAGTHMGAVTKPEPNKSESGLTLGVLRPFVVSRNPPLNETH